MRSSAKAVGTPKASEAAISMVENMRIGCILSFSCWRQNRRELIENVIRVRWVPMGILNLWMPHPNISLTREVHSYSAEHTWRGLCPRGPPRQDILAL